MRPRSRPGYGLFQLLVVLALIALVLGMTIPAIVKARLAAARAQQANNLRQICLAVHNCNDTNNRMPAGVDDKQFSSLFYLLPYLERDNIFKSTDRTVDSDDKANAKIRSMRIEIFESPLDPLDETATAGGTNYFAMAGSKMSLKDNDGAFFRDSNSRIPQSFPDGTSNTVIFVEMMRGDGGKKAVSVQRQHLRLKAADLATLKVADGAKDWEGGKHIVADRGSAWIDGRFLKATTNATRGMLDPKPDVDCGGEGGLAGIRAVGEGTHVGMCDGTARWITSKLTLFTWQNACNASDGNPLGSDW